VFVFLEEKENEEKTTKNGKTEKHGKKAKPQKTVKKSHSVQFSHPWLACNLKGHSGQVLTMDVSPNGKYLITASDGLSAVYSYCKLCQVWILMYNS
jgi:WD40 repeat protein